MILTIPKNRKKVNNWKLADLTRKTEVTERTSFHTKHKRDYSALTTLMRENRIKK